MQSPNEHSFPARRNVQYVILDIALGLTNVTEAQRMRRETAALSDYLSDILKKAAFNLENVN